MSRIRNAPWRANSTAETAREAAIAMEARAPSLMAQALEILLTGPKTPEEITAIIAERTQRKVLLTSIRPRLTQLARAGKVRDSGQRGLGESGVVRSIKWELIPQADAAAGDA